MRVRNWALILLALVTCVLGSTATDLANAPVLSMDTVTDYVPVTRKNMALRKILISNIRGVDSARAAHWADSCRFCSGGLGDSARASHIADSAKVAGRTDSARVSGLSDSAKVLVWYARVTALHDTADTLRQRIKDTSATLRALIAAREPAISAGTTVQYWRGDKTWQTLPTSMAPSGTASGDLSGTYPGPTVAKVNGASLPASKAFVGTNASSQIIDATSTTTTAAMEPAHTGDMTNTAGSLATTVKGLNGALLSGLATGILKNTTTTGVPSIAVATDFPTLNQNTTGSAATLTTGRTIGITGDATGTSAAFNGSAAVTIPLTLASTITAGGPTGGAATVPVITYDAKGRLTAVSTATITPAAIGAEPLWSTSNAIPKGSGSTGLTASSLSDNGTVVTTTEPIQGGSAMIAQSVWSPSTYAWIGQASYNVSGASAWAGYAANSTGGIWAQSASGAATALKNAGGGEVQLSSLGISFAKNGVGYSDGYAKILSGYFATAATIPYSDLSGVLPTNNPAFTGNLTGPGANLTGQITTTVGNAVQKNGSATLFSGPFLTTFNTAGTQGWVLQLGSANTWDIWNMGSNSIVGNFGAGGSFTMNGGISYGGHLTTGAAIKSANSTLTAASPTMQTITASGTTQTLPAPFAGGMFIFNLRGAITVSWTDGSAHIYGHSSLYTVYSYTASGTGSSAVMATSDGSYWYLSFVD